MTFVCSRGPGGTLLDFSFRNRDDKVLVEICLCRLMTAEQQSPIIQR
jgi:hypothetical protein